MALVDSRANIQNGSSSAQPESFIKGPESVHVDISNGKGVLRKGDVEELPIVFNNLHYSVKSKEIIKGGPTGSGKTTLLNILAHRIIPSAGTISYGPYQWSKALKRHVGVVEQDDIVFPTLTVRQNLRFIALLRLPRNMKSSDKYARVDEVIEKLRLTTCADTKIGNEMNRGISGGERKRLCIAGEFITRPRIILFDEPTSGLDSTMAQMVVENMQTIASEGVVVISSIHQPSSRVFHTFNDLLMLDSGEIIYHGPIKGCTEKFIGFGLKCPESYNAADFLMDVIVLNQLSSLQRQELLKYFRQTYEQPGNLMTLKEVKRERYQTSWLTQVKLLSERAFLSVKEDLISMNTFILYSGLAILAGLLWFNVGLEESDIYTRTTLALWIVGTWMFFPLFESLHFFSSRMVALKKELYVNSYRLSAYFVAETTVSLIPALFWATFWVGVVYAFTLGATGSFVHFLMLYSAILLSIISIQAIGLSISAGISEKNVITFAMLMITYFFGYSGLFVPLQNMPAWLSWSYYGNFLVYTYQLTMYIFFIVPNQDYTCLSSSETNFASCKESNESSVITPQEIAELIGIVIPPWLSAVVLFCGAIVFRILAYRLLRWDIQSSLKKA